MMFAFSRRAFSGKILPCLLAVAGALPARAALEYTLVVHHFLGAKSNVQTKVLEPWAARVEKASDGRIAVKIYPSMTLGGGAAELYQQVRDGVIDIVWTVPGYTPGAFPRAEVFTLPNVHRGSALATTMAMRDIWPMLAADFENIKVLLLHAHKGNGLHLRSHDVQGVDDIRGLKIRAPSRTGAWMVEGWGAEAVNTTADELAQMLEAGEMDGALLPFDVLSLLRVDALTERSVAGLENRRFGTAVFLFAMNKQRYDALPADLREIIDAESGAAFAEEMGRVMDDVEAAGMDEQRESGGEVVYLSGEAMDEFEKRGGEESARRWLAEMKKLGIDGESLLNAARQAVLARE